MVCLPNSPITPSNKYDAPSLLNEVAPLETLLHLGFTQVNNLRKRRNKGFKLVFKQLLLVPIFSHLGWIEYSSESVEKGFTVIVPGCSVANHNQRGPWTKNAIWGGYLSKGRKKKKNTFLIATQFTIFPLISVMLISVIGHDTDTEYI